MKHIAPDIETSKTSGTHFANTASPREFAEAINLSVHDNISSLKSEWKKAEKLSNISVYQRFEWVEAYLKNQSQNEDLRPFIIVARLEEELVFILPLVLKGKYLTRVKFIGGSHVNFNMGLFPKPYLDLMTPYTFKKIFARIQDLVPGLGYLALCCQPDSWEGEKNPLLYEPHQLSSNPAFFLDLSGGFDETLARGNAKRKRKKFRQQCRLADSQGGYEFIKHQTRKEAEMLIDAFLQQKSKRLRDLGIKDVFADPHVKDFLLDLANKSIGRKSPLLQLYGLKVGEKIAAVFGAGVMEKHLSGFFSSIDADQFAELSPGEMLLYLTVKDACEQGYTKMDLGAGDERYKRSWSTETVEMYEIFMPYNTMSMPVVAARRFYGTLRRVIRANEISWNFFKKLRKQAAWITKKAA